MTSYSIAEANSKLAQIIREAERGEPIELTRRGQPVAVVLSMQEYERWKQSHASWKSLAELRARYELDKQGLTAEEEDVFANVRDKSPGRDFKFED